MKKNSRKSENSFGCFYYQFISQERPAKELIAIRVYELGLARFLGQAHVWTEKGKQGNVNFTEVFHVVVRYR